MIDSVMLKNPRCRRHDSGPSSPSHHSKIFFLPETLGQEAAEASLRSAICKQQESHWPEKYPVFSETDD